VAVKRRRYVYVCVMCVCVCVCVFSSMYCVYSRSLNHYERTLASIGSGSKKTQVCLCLCYVCVCVCVCVSVCVCFPQCIVCTVDLWWSPSFTTNARWPV
jgi:hypothetical protein